MSAITGERSCRSGLALRSEVLDSSVFSDSAAECDIAVRLDVQRTGTVTLADWETSDTKAGSIGPETDKL